MKKSTLLALAVVLTLSPFLQSCLDVDDESSLNDRNYPWLAFSTIRTIEDVKQGYYFALDDNTKLYPGDTTAIHNYLLIDGQRAFVHFDYLKEPHEGYDSNIKVGRITNILTKEIVELTEENKEKIGDDKINVKRYWIAQGYLNIEFQYFGTQDTNKKHFINLVQNTLSSENEEEGYISLEFRHNAEGDYPAHIGDGYVSFKLDKIKEQMEDTKGLKIRVNTIYEGTLFDYIDFKKEEKSNTFSTLDRLNISPQTTATTY